MTKTIGNEELAYLFDDTNFSAKKGGNKKSKNYQELERLYKLDNIFVPEKGQVVTAKYTGKTAGQYIFSVDGCKDDIRIEDR